MKKIKIVGIAILALAICALLGITAFASDNQITYTADLSTSVVCGDKDAEVIVRVGFDRSEVLVSGVQFVVTASEDLGIEGAANDKIQISKGKDGSYLWLDMSADLSGATIDYVADIKIVIPADTDPGEYQVTISKLQLVDPDAKILATESRTVTATIKVVGHTPVTDAAKAPTCTETGLTEGSHCSVCQEVLVKQEVVPANGHNPGEIKKENEVAPDCVNTGSYDNVTYCTVCSAQTSRETVTVSANGHNYGTWIDEIPATCEGEGTLGHFHCSVCSKDFDANKNILESLVIAPINHDMITDKAVDPTCTATGLTEGSHCSRCDYKIAQEVVGALNHDMITDKAVAPTCTATGLTEGSHCSRCDYKIAQEVVGALGHKYVAVTTPATCVTPGDTTYTCSVCKDSYKDIIDPDPDNHASDEVTYSANATTHSAIYDCCGAPYVTDEPHSYDDETALCACGVAKKFTYTVYGMNGEIVYTKEVAYGSEIYKYVDKKFVSNRYGESFAIVEAITVSGADVEAITVSGADLWADGAIMPKGNVEIQAYWSGWSTDDLGAKYIAKNVALKGWFEVDGAYYYANAETAYVVVGTVRAPYPTFDINGITYAPNAEDVEYAASKGIEFIDAESAWFVFGEDGKLECGLTAIQDGKYVENGMIAWHAGLVNVNGELYYFVGDTDNGGNKLANGNVWVTRTNDVAGLTKGACYNFKDGQLSGQTGIVDGKYFENSEMMLGKGLVKLGNKYIYVRSNGSVVMDAQYYIDENSYGLVAGNYYFDANGYMVDPNTNLYNGVVDGYYYVNGKVAYGAGLIEIDGDIYYVRSNGQVATGKYYISNTNGMEGFTSGQKLVFDDEGKLLPVKDGIVDGYYYVNGSIAYAAGLIEIDGDIYYVRSNGQIATGKYYVTNVNDMEGFTSGQKLFFDENGALINE